MKIEMHVQDGLANLWLTAEDQTDASQLLRLTKSVNAPVVAQMHITDKATSVYLGIPNEPRMNTTDINGKAKL